MLNLRKLWVRFKGPVCQTRRLLAAIAAVGPAARAWSERQDVADSSVQNLCQLGKSAIDQIPQFEAYAVTSLILVAIQRRAGRTNAALLAGAGLAISRDQSEFGLARNLYKTFEEIERLQAEGTPETALARLGNQLTVPYARRLLTHMAGLKQLNFKSRQLLQQATQIPSLLPKLVFAALLDNLPATLSAECSPTLRHDWQTLRSLQASRQNPAPGLWERLLAAFRSLGPALP